MRHCDSVLELAKELGVHRSVLYQWRDQLAPLDRAEWREAQETGESPLERENRRLKLALAEKTLEVDFFKGALQKSRLDARATAKLARRHLGPNPGADVDARQIGYRADVSTGWG
jgi:transposase-like protein